MQYRTLENIRLDGRAVDPGDLIELTETEAAQLLASKAIEPIHKRFTRLVVVPGAADQSKEPS